MEAEFCYKCFEAALYQLRKSDISDDVRIFTRELYISPEAAVLTMFIAISRLSAVIKRSISMLPSSIYRPK